MIPLRCGYCGWRGQAVGDEADVALWVSSEVGHPMFTLDMAVAHICCPRCDRTRLAVGIENEAEADDG